MGFEKISVPSVREQFVQKLENTILSGELQIGDKLPPSRELCSLMGVSLTTVNAGIAELCSKGFLEVKPRHGTYVADYIKKGTSETLLSLFRYNGGHLNPREIRSLTECRMALDPYVLQLVVQRASGEQLRALAEDVRQIKACQDAEGACVLVTEFFRKLYELSDNIAFSLIYRTSIDVQKGIYALSFRKNGLSSLKASTEKLYEALLARDEEAAGAVATAWLKRVLGGPSSLV